MIMPREKVERLLPLTIDERIAKDENQRLNDDEPVIVSREDNHITHIRMHISCKDTKAAKAHIVAHETAIVLQRLRPELFPGSSFEAAPPGLPASPGGGGQGQPLATPAPEGAVP